MKIHGQNHSFVFSNGHCSEQQALDRMVEYFNCMYNFTPEDSLKEARNRVHIVLWRTVKQIETEIEWGSR